MSAASSLNSLFRLPVRASKQLPSKLNTRLGVFRPRVYLAIGGGAVGLRFLSASTISECKPGDGPEEPAAESPNEIPPVKDEKSDAVVNALEQMRPLLNQLGFGGVMGACSGYAAKKLGKVGDSERKILK